MTLKATGLISFLWGLSKEERLVKYMTKDGERIEIKQKEVIVVKSVKSGLNAFGQHKDDLKIFSEFEQSS